jgi:hypothetical protein
MLTGHEVEVLAPYRSAKRDPDPRWCAQLSRVRYRIDTVLMHTFAVLLNIGLGNSLLQLARVVAT